MRILWVSVAPFVNNGFGTGTRTILPRLRELGHEVACLGVFGFEGGVLHWNGIPCFPRMHKLFGQDVIVPTAEHFQADIVITFLDAWAIDPRPFGPGLRWCPLFPVDSDPLSPLVAQKAAYAWQPLTFSRHGEQACAAAGIPAEYLPLAVDTRVFAPRDRADARMASGLPTRRFIVGMVAQNVGHPPRKALPQCIEAFARFRERHADALLYLHTNQGLDGEFNAANIRVLVESKGLGEAVRFADPQRLLLGFSDAEMADLFGSFDVLLSPSLGEGFGLPILEAQACGVPVILGDWTSMPELCFAGWRIPKSDAERMWTTHGAWQHVPRLNAIVAALESAYDGAGAPGMKEAARAGALAFDADRILQEFWSPWLHKLEERIRDESRTGLIVRSQGSEPVPKNPHCRSSAPRVRTPPYKFPITIVTPWLDHVELIEDFERAVAGAHIVVVDNGSVPESASRLVEMVRRLRGTYLRKEMNRGFAAACNEGLAVPGQDIVVFLNNDILSDADWLFQVPDEVPADALVGPSLGAHIIDGAAVRYISGWCIAGRRALWDRLGGWDQETFALPYWEDVDLGWRAQIGGVSLHQSAWRIRHKGGKTAGFEPGARRSLEDNRLRFEEKVREQRRTQAAGVR